MQMLHVLADGAQQPQPTLRRIADAPLHPTFVLHVCSTLLSVAFLHVAFLHASTHTHRCLMPTFLSCAMQPPATPHCCW